MVNYEDIVEEIRYNLKNEFGDEIKDYEMLTPVTYEEIRSDYGYRVKMTDVNQVIRYNFRSDYWGSADDYRRENEIAMETLQHYMNKEVMCDGTVLRILGMLIDRQYNSIYHTDVLVEEVSTDEPDAFDQF